MHIAAGYVYHFASMRPPEFTGGNAGRVLIRFIAYDRLQ